MSWYCGSAVAAAAMAVSIPPHRAASKASSHVIWYVGRLQTAPRHTGPELHTGGVRGSKPAGFRGTGE